MSDMHAYVLSHSIFLEYFTIVHIQFKIKSFLKVIRSIIFFYPMIEIGGADRSLIRERISELESIRPTNTEEFMEREKKIEYLLKMLLKS